MLLGGLRGVAAAGAAAAPAEVSSFTASGRARFCFLQLATTDAAARACTMLALTPRRGGSGARLLAALVRFATVEL